MHHPGIIRGRSPSADPLLRVAVALGCLLSAATGASGRELSFGERVAAQERIERIFWAHRSWPGENPAPRPPFEQVLPEAVLRARVEDILRESRALESLWGRAISGEELQNEMNRMARSTRDAGVLRELFDALGKDPARIAECLARPLLVDRVLRELYSSDARWHGRLRETATAERARYRSPADLRRMSGTYSETTFVREDSEHAKRVAAGTASVRVLPKSDWELELGRLAAIFDRSEPLLRHHEAAVADGAGPEGTNDPTGSLQFPLLEPTAVIEEESSLRVVMVLARDATSLKIATVEWPKRDFDSWWQRAGTTFPVRISTPACPYTLPEISADPCSPDTWASTRFDLPDPRIGHTSVWTGSEMIVWGGGSGSTSNTGGRYDPATDSWRTTSTVGAPSPRSFHTAVWTGTEMIVWGGNLEPDRTGGRYNPVIDTWMPTSTANAPPSRLYHTAVWTGAEMIVWGGDAGNYGSYSTNTGGRYNPLTDAWLLTSTSGVAERSRHTAVWTGAEMIVWGGHDESTGASLDSGQRYDPSADSWSSVATRDAPSMRLDHTAVWTGTEMIVWGGRTTEATGPALNTGARYDPARNRWTPTTLTGTPKARFLHTAVWSGSEMIVWGGETLTASLGTGARYRPGKNDSWLPVSNLGAPQRRGYHTAVWTGSEMIVWGGWTDGDADLNSGGRYNPSGDSWLATSSGDHPAARFGHTAVWTGSEMIVWGGTDGLTRYQTGGRYVPATDSWMATSGSNAPAGRSSHSAVWTGAEMIVWGGSDGRASLDSGGHYDPASDSWRATSSTGAPSARSGHTAVWTGSEMIVWGGSGTAGFLQSGGLYDPLSQVWSTTSTAGAPTARAGHTAVWTSQEMIVWGGNDGITALRTGGRYDPSTDSWLPTQTVVVCPWDRSYHTAVWTGSEMIVWGGRDLNYHYYNDGGRFSPLNGWTCVTANGPPSPRDGHTAVWTGLDMVVWGGTSGYPVYGDGSRYRPDNNSWLPTSLVGAPPARYDHTAVWTGSEMIVWGGEFITATGGRYCACTVAAPSGSPVLSVSRGSGEAVLNWAALPGASSYDVVRGSLSSLFASRGDFTSSVERCLANDLTATTLIDPDVPVSDAGFWYLVRGSSCGGAGSWNDGSSGQVGSRDSELNGSPNSCP